MRRLIYCPFTGCCPLRVIAYTNTIVSRLINTSIIPFLRSLFSINVSYDELMGMLFQSIDSYCERELEITRRVVGGSGTVVVKACRALPRIGEILRIDRYSGDVIVNLRRVPDMCFDELPNSSVKYRVNYRFSEAAARTILLYTAMYAIYRVRGVDPVITGEQIVDVFSKQLVNTWRSRMGLIPVVVDGVELYLDWNKKDFVARLKKLLIDIARQ